MLSRLRKISQFLTTNITMADAIQFLELNACHSGEKSRIFFGGINAGVNLDHTINWNVHLDPSFHKTYVQLIRSLFPEEVIKSQSIIFHSHNERYQSNFSRHFGFFDEELWKSTIVMPFPPDYFAALSITEESASSSSVEDYYVSLYSVLKLFLLSRVSRRKGITRSDSAKREKLDLAPLSERQELILKLMKEGEINKTIATRMGYSESLIRQETIAIYRKLEIGGRKGLEMKVLKIAAENETSVSDAL